jgi:hypothetical protein
MDDFFSTKSRNHKKHTSILIYSNFFRFGESFGILLNVESSCSSISMGLNLIQDVNIVRPNNLRKAYFSIFIEPYLIFFFRILHHDALLRHHLRIYASSMMLLGKFLLKCYIGVRSLQFIFYMESHTFRSSSKVCI